MTGRSCILTQTMGILQMTHFAVRQESVSEALTLPRAYLEKHWYAIYTCANHEKRVAQQLIEREVEHFLPLYSSVRRWSDRRVKVDLPLFSGYVFARFILRDRLRVQQIPGVARLVGFGGTPTALPEEQIEALKTTLAGGVRAQPHPYLTIGQRVRVKAGPLEGCEGILRRRKGCFRFVLSLDLIRRSVIVEVGAAEIESLSTSWKARGERGTAIAFEY